MRPRILPNRPLLLLATVDDNRQVNSNECDDVPLTITCRCHTVVDGMDLAVHRAVRAIAAVLDAIHEAIGGYTLFIVVVVVVVPIRTWTPSAAAKVVALIDDSCPSPCL